MILPLPFIRGGLGWGNLFFNLITLPPLNLPLIKGEKYIKPLTAGLEGYFPSPYKGEKK
jgi:hypothetical protein